MSLNRYVRQLNPIQENKINYVERVQDLYEATLSKKDITKRDNQLYLVERRSPKSKWRKPKKISEASKDKASKQ